MEAKRPLNETSQRGNEYCFSPVPSGASLHSELSLDQRNEVTGERARVDRRRDAPEGDITGPLFPIPSHF